MPIAAGIQVGGGLLQALLSGKKKSERELEKQADSYSPNGSVLDFYNKALNRYSTNPYENPLFQQQKNLIQRNLTTGLGASQTRRGGLAALSPLVQQANDATANAAIRTDQTNQQALGVLGQAARMKAGEETKKFDMIYNLKSMKAGAANDTMKAGLGNIFQGAGNYMALKGMQTHKPSTANERSKGGTSNLYNTWDVDDNYP